MSGVAGLSDDPVKDRGVTASEIAPLPNSLLPELIQMSFLSTVVHSICFPLVKKELNAPWRCVQNTTSYFHSVRSQNTGRMSGTLRGARTPKYYNDL